MKRTLAMLLALVGVVLFTDSSSASLFLPFFLAHCDSLDGPIVKAARTAFEQGEVGPLLKWVRKQDEHEIEALFKKTLIVRGKGREAHELADAHFLETLVRLHRAGEGEPYTGLKPAGSVEPAVVAADKALENGSVEDLVSLITDAASHGIRERFGKASAAKKHADHGVDAGRKFVEAYVHFTHYVERLHLDATGKAEHRHNAAGPESEELHQHHP